MIGTPIMKKLVALQGLLCYSHISLYLQLRYQLIMKDHSWRLLYKIENQTFMTIQCSALK